MTVSIANCYQSVMIRIPCNRDACSIVTFNLALNFVCLGIPNENRSITITRNNVTWVRRGINVTIEARNCVSPENLLLLIAEALTEVESSYSIINALRDHLCIILYCHRGNHTRQRGILHRLRLNRDSPFKNSQVVIRRRRDKSLVAIKKCYSTHLTQMTLIDLLYSCIPGIILFELWGINLHIDEFECLLFSKSGKCESLKYKFLVRRKWQGCYISTTGRAQKILALNGAMWQFF